MQLDLQSGRDGAEKNGHTDVIDSRKVAPAALTSEGADERGQLDVIDKGKGKVYTALSRSRVTRLQTMFGYQTSDFELFSSVVLLPSAR